MKHLLVAFIVILTGCANLQDRSKDNNEFSVNCSQAAMQDLQSNLDTATKELKAAGDISDRDPTDENNAKTSEAAANVALYYSMLEISRSDCSAK